MMSISATLTDAYSKLFTLLDADGSCNTQMLLCVVDTVLWSWLGFKKNIDAVKIQNIDWNIQMEWKVFSHKLNGSVFRALIKC